MTDRLDLFGEVLFDCFPDGRRVLGGAPFNVSWHLRAFGLAPRLISRVGEDADGAAIRQAMADWSMDHSAIGRDPERPTGRVEVAISEGEPNYDIVYPAAWDAIESPAVGAQHGWLYHGSLALRDARSRATLESLLTGSSLKVFIDVNLRDPWWDTELLLDCLQRASWAKLNEHELDLLAPPGEDEERRAMALMERAGLDGLVLTRGAAGAMILESGGTTVRAPAPAHGQVMDTVGAGDAFSAVVLLAHQNEWPMDIALERALDFAAAVCGLRGATTTNRSFYSSWLTRWGLGMESTDHV